MDLLKLKEYLTDKEFDKVVFELVLMKRLDIIEDYWKHFNFLIEEKGMSMYQATYHTYYEMVLQPGTGLYKPEFNDKIKKYYSENSY